MKIPVEFKTNDKSFKGFLTSVPGSGGTFYHLYVRRQGKAGIGDYFAGQFWQIEQGWQFASQKRFNADIAKQLEQALAL
ncbi:hypothetical protein ABDK00_013975 [Niabella insulamsoli]|uniref:hypothetical protein n=1 Tax=Niabella insulamsoli TaxID=3144874 RepID=UPI0031FC0EC3